MADYEYHPDVCSACHRQIAQDEAVVIIDNVKERPRYYHEKCLYDFFDVISALHNWAEKWKGANDERF